MAFFPLTTSVMKTFFINHQFKGVLLHWPNVTEHFPNNQYKGHYITICMVWVSFLTIIIINEKRTNLLSSPHMLESGAGLESVTPPYVAQYNLMEKPYTDNVFTGKTCLLSTPPIHVFQENTLGLLPNTRCSSRDLHICCTYPRSHSPLLRKKKGAGQVPHYRETRWLSLEELAGLSMMSLKKMVAWDRAGDELEEDSAGQRWIYWAGKYLMCATCNKVYIAQKINYIYCVQAGDPLSALRTTPLTCFIQLGETCLVLGARLYAEAFSVD